MSGGKGNESYLDFYKNGNDGDHILEEPGEGHDVI